MVCLRVSPFVHVVSLVQEKDRGLSRQTGGKPFEGLKFGLKIGLKFRLEFGLSFVL